MKITLYNKTNQFKGFLDGVLVPAQPHLANIVEIKTWKEDLSQADGIFTSRKNNFKLGVKTADCSAITMYDENFYWVVHAGWRGLVLGIVEKMLEKFENPTIYVAPFYKKFEIQKDFCYDMIEKKFWKQFFEEKDWKILFDFQWALKSVLPSNAVLDKRDTFFDKDFYSWRREKTKKRNYITLENKK